MTIPGGRSASFAMQSPAAPLAISLRLISCHVCIKEIPYSELVNEEATDYVIYYFGLDCFDTWRHLAEVSRTSALKTGPDSSFLQFWWQPGADPNFFYVE